MKSNYLNSFRRSAVALALCAIVALETVAGHAAAFTPGNVVVYRAGSGTGSLANTGNPVFLNEYTPSGVLVQSVAMPTTTSGAQRPLVCSGTATSEGLLTRSANGRYLILAGYGSTLPAASSLTASASATVPRVIGRVTGSGTIDTSTALTDAVTGNNPRSAASDDGTRFWIGGGAGGVRAVGALGATTSTQITTFANTRQLLVLSGQLYVSSGSAPNVAVNTVGTGLPTTSGQTVAVLSGFTTATTSPSPYGYFFADLSAGVAGVDTLYVTDDNTARGITKYSLVGGSWVANGTVGVGADAYRGITATVSGTTVTLFATRKGGSAAAGGGELVTLTDSSGYNATLTGTPTLLATAAANTAFRGVVLAPVNRAPVTTNFTLGASSGVAASFKIIGGKNSPTDADGDTLTITSVGAAANGSTSTDGTNVTYTSTGSFSGTNTFTYTVSDGFGGTSTASVTVVVIGVAQGFNQLAPPVNNGNGTYTLSYLGVPGQKYALEESPNLVAPFTWFPVITNTASGVGAIGYTAPLSYPSGSFRTRHVP